VQSAVLDAHRGQFFCGLYPETEPARELLLTAGEINSMGGLPLPVAVCEETVAQALEMLLEVEPLRVAPPTAWHALQFGSARWVAGEFADPATLDGYYLRGADAKPGSRE
jgi:tRNA threonylcarbamoyladenosine biosynthesis protein TsaB